MSQFGFVRVAAAVPVLSLADPRTNADRTLGLLQRAQTQDIHIAVFPELGLTGYTCHDLYHQTALLDAAIFGLESLAEKSGAVFDGLAVVGLPVVVDNQVFNCAAVIHRGQVLGLIPKSYLPNYKEFYDARYFAPASQGHSDSVTLPSGAEIPFGTDILFASRSINGLIVGVEICEDLWTPIPPSCRQSLTGATVLLNLSASNELVGKVEYRRELVRNQSARCIAAYVYSGAGVHESTQDLVFGGHCLIAENGSMLADSERFSRTEQLTVADIDVQRLRADRWRTTSFGQSAHYSVGGRPYRIISFDAPAKTPGKLVRVVDAHPFVPKADAELRHRCDEIFHIQVAALAKRLESLTSLPPVTIGVSGGLDSTLALLVTCKTFDALGIPRSKITGFTLPGFGTTERTKTNAHALMKQLGITAKEIDIRPLCLLEWKTLGHSPFGISVDGLDVPGLMQKLQHIPREKRHDLVFENVQARVRTNLLMNAGFVIGTGDLSELALGWCTYNADHMSMYNVNVGVPKTLVKFLVSWAAEHEFGSDERKTLQDIVATVISPELLPTFAGGQVQSTEAVIGPYELHDFFLYHMMRYGASPAKIRYLAGQARFDQSYSADEIGKWLTVFIKRFFGNQFKRSALPDGPKVGSISLSPRGDWRMPPDAKPDAWLSEPDA